MNGRPWADFDNDFLRRHYRKLPARRLAFCLNRPLASVYGHARTLGLSLVAKRIAPGGIELLRTLAAAGQCNRCIGRAVGFGREQVRAWRRRLGLPDLASRGSVDSCMPCKERTRAKTRAQLDRAGLNSLAQTRTAAYRRFAVESGWPEDLRPRAVQILNALAARGVPMTRLELAAAIGMRTDRIGGNGTLALCVGNGPGGTYTATLLRLGLLAVLKRGAVVEGRGKGKSRDLYYLGPKALAILEERARCKTATATTV